MNSSDDFQKYVYREIKSNRKRIMCGIIGFVVLVGLLCSEKCMSSSKKTDSNMLQNKEIPNTIKKQVNSKKTISYLNPLNHHNRSGLRI